MSAPCDLTATAARALIGTKRLSPVELMQSCIDRILDIDPAVNAMVARDFGGALDAARAAEAAVMRGDALGPMHGLPVGIKDLDEAAGLPTTWGSPLFRDHVSTSDDGMVARVRAGGAIVLGKTNTPEFGAGANTRNSVYGATGNPFNPALSSAGSSGGSAVALATGMVPLASGSDMGGSLRNPAAFCGIVGFRPSMGMVASEKRGLGWSHLSTAGPMARNVADVCLLYASQVGFDARDPLSRAPSGDVLRGVPVPVDLASVRAAFSPDLGFAPTERLIRQSFAEKTGLFRHLFAEARDAAPDCRGADEAFEVLRGVGFLASHLGRYRTTPELLGPNVIANVEEALGYSAYDVARALSAQTAMYWRWQEFFGDVDVVITPSITLSPRPWRELAPTEIDGQPTRTYFHWLALAYGVTLVGHPAVSLPVGLDGNGMPFGLQIIGRQGGDAAVLGVAAALERELAGDSRTARPVPDLAALRAAPPISQAEGFFGFA
jgi:Asp-tRNA(Asn)/Glu-tRNA(Gln) amidotransferase A subunit family amidase